jgi:hypothetical protein
MWPRWQKAARLASAFRRPIGSDKAEIREVALAEQCEFTLCTAAVEPQAENRERSGHLILLS